MLSPAVDRWQSLEVTENLAPGFLVASPSLSCPFFHHALVLMVEHGAEGSFGFVVNKTAGIALDAIADELELARDPERAVDIPVMLGGPVSPHTGWVLFDPTGRPMPSQDTVQLGEALAVTASARVLKRFADRSGPERMMLLLGYSGWSPGQLEAEMKDGSWIPIDLDPALIFETPVEDRWELGLRTLGIDPSRVVGQSVASA
jgi:putative transcriptional regulator